VRLSLCQTAAPLAALPDARDEYRTAHAVEAESEDAIRATLARDPWSGTHLEVDSIEPWTIRLDARHPPSAG